jgi:hypothetical protein
MCFHGWLLGVKLLAADESDDELAYREVLLLRALHDVRREFFVGEAEWSAESILDE